jgi:hypothetical protein
MTRPRARCLAAAVLAAATLAGPKPALADCPGDCTGDYYADIQDFLRILAEWGTPGWCDYNTDGVVDTLDFLALLVFWGPCVEQITLDIELQGVFQECERCIHVDELGCVVTDVVLPFTDHDGDPETPVRFVGTITIEGIKCDTMAPVCVKDEQHTLAGYWDPYEDQVVVVLRPGDLDNDNDVDIVDMAGLLQQMGLPARDGGCPWDGTVDGDLNCDGIVDEADLAILEGNAGEVSGCPGLAPGP